MKIEDHPIIKWLREAERNKEQIIICFKGNLTEGKGQLQPDDKIENALFGIPTSVQIGRGFVRLNLKEQVILQHNLSNHRYSTQTRTSPVVLINLPMELPFDNDLLGKDCFEKERFILLPYDKKTHDMLMSYLVR